MGVMKTLRSLGSALRPGEESAEIRRFLSDAYNTLADISTAESYNSYSLDLALQEYLDELDGTPSSGRQSRSARLTTLLNAVNTRVAQAIQLEPEVLGDEVVVGQAFAQLSGFLPDVGKLSLPDTLPDSLPDVGGLPMPTSALASLTGTAVPQAKDVLG